MEERTEHLQIAGHRRDQVHHYDVAIENDGTIIGLKDRAVADNGVASALAGWGMPYVTAFSLPGSYKIPNYDIDLSIVATNKGALNAYRGYGKESASFVMDRVMDVVARRLQMNRAEVCRKNFIRPDEFPFEQMSGMRADSGNYAGVLNMALEKAGYADFPKQQEEARKQGCYLGLGIGFESTPEGGCIPGNFIAAYDSATVRMSPTGTVTVLTSMISPGGGNETGIAQNVADLLGVVLEYVKVLQGDTLVCSFGIGNWSSRSLTVGSAAFAAAGDLRDKLLRVAGNMLETAPDDFDLAEGNIFIKQAPQRSMAIADVTRVIYPRAFTLAALDIEPGLESTRYYRMGNLNHIPDAQGRINIYPTYPFDRRGRHDQWQPNHSQNS
jgi:carbon-monoxide dehydrogenase large subunit